MRILLTAPYVGEFGWELMAWQARVRWVFQRAKFERVVVLGSAGKAALYEDMPGEYRVVDLSTVPGVPMQDGRILPGQAAMLPAEQIRAALDPMVSSIARELGSSGDTIRTFWPCFDGSLWPCHASHQVFVPFKRAARLTRPAPWVLLVRRDKATGHDNWSSQQWDDLAERLSGMGIQVSDYPCDAERAMELLAACDLAVGQSTGGLHMASLCRCPHLVWSPQASRLWTRWEMTNRQRYETFWNPLGTPVQFRGGDSLPDVATVADWIMEALPRIGRRTGSLARRARFWHRWQWRSWLAQNILPSPLFRRCPWPFQRFVRYRLV